MPRELSTPWSSDVPPSMPAAPKVARLVPMGGFCFTENGLAHDLSEEDVVALSTPFYAPARRAES